MSMMGPTPGIAGMAVAAAAAASKLGPIDALLAGFNTNPYFIGLMMLFLNLGGRFLSMEVTKGQEAFFSHPFVRRGLIFVVLFVATRNLVTAFWLWLIIILSLGYLFNENSSLCILGPGGLKGSSCESEGAAKAKAAAGPAPPMPTDQELSIYKLLNEKVKVWEAFETAATAAEDTEDGTDASAGGATDTAATSTTAGVTVNSAAVSKQLLQDNLNKSTGGTNNSTLAKMGPGASLSGATMALLKGDVISTTSPSF